MSGGSIETVKERIDIVDLIGAKVQLRQAGRTFKGRCPFHEEKTPSFVVYPDSQSYHCFGCGKSGDAFTFVMETESLDFRDALKQLAERAGVELQSTRRERPDPQRDQLRDRLIELHDRAAAFYSNALWMSDSGAESRSYLERRGIDRKTAETWGLGFAPDSFDALKSFLVSRGATEEELVLAGLLVQSNENNRTWDRFRNRIMIPIRRRDGSIVGFGGRAMGDVNPKYLNTSQTPIFDKSTLLYGLDRAMESIRRQRSVVLVEGYMDAIAAHQFGYTNVVATMGTAMTIQQVTSFRRYTDAVYLALDSDAAGQLATMRGIDAVRETFTDEERVQVLPGNVVRFERTLGAEIRVVLLPSGKDPDDFIRQDPGAWPAALESAVPLVEYVLTQRLATISDSPSERSRALHDIAVPILKELGDPLVLAHYVAMTAQMLRFRDTEVQSAILRSTNPRSQQSSGGVIVDERPAAHDPERFLIKLALRFPDAARSALNQVERDDILDTRHRMILDALASSTGGSEVVLESLDPEIQDYATELMAEDADNPQAALRLISRELPPTMRRLAQVRHTARLQHLRAELDEAKRDGDQEAVRQFLTQISQLAASQSRFDPQTSPYFKDTRSTP